MNHLKNVYYYTAPWCAPCKRLLPMARRIAEEAGVQRFEVIDIDRNPELVPPVVKGVPTILVTRGGEAEALLSPDMVSPAALRKVLA